MNLLFQDSFMIYFKQRYHTPEGFDDLVMCSDGEMLTGLWFEGKKDTGGFEKFEATSLPSVFSDTCRWLDIYFSGRQPDFTPAYRLDDLTSFRKQVSNIMCGIPFGQTMTYGEIARQISRKMSAQAVGGAVGWNPICLIVPCHRVVGTNGNLTGYGGGMNNKIALLCHEGNDMSHFGFSAKSHLL